MALQGAEVQPELAGRAGRNRVLGWAALGVAVSLLAPSYWLAFRAPAAGVFHDDAIYMVTGKALAGGQGYRIVSLPEEISQTKYPPLVPFLLSLVWRAAPSFPENVVYLRLIPFGFFLLWSAFTYRWLLDALGAAGPAAGIVLITASSTWIWFYANSMWSEMPFCFFVAAAIVLFDRMPEGNRKLVWAAGLGLLCSWAWLCRAPGIAVVAAAGLMLLWKRELRAAVVFTLIVAAHMAPWYLHVRAAGTVPNALYQYYGVQNYTLQNILFDYSLADKLLIAATNLFLSVFSIPLSLGWEWMPLNWLAAAVSTPLFLLGFVRELRTRVDFKLLVFAISLFVYLTRAWPPTRFLSILLPFALYYVYRGVEAACSRLGPRVRAAQAGFVLAGLTFGASAYHLLQLALQVPRTGIVWASSYDGESWDGILETASFVRGNLPAGEPIFTHSDPLMWLLSGHKAITYSTFSPLHLYYRLDSEQGLDLLPFDLVDPSPPHYVVDVQTPGIAGLDRVGNNLDNRLAAGGPAKLLFQSTSGKSRVIVEQ